MEAILLYLFLILVRISYQHVIFGVAAVIATRFLHAQSRSNIFLGSDQVEKIPRSYKPKTNDRISLYGSSRLEMFG